MSKRLDADSNPATTDESIDQAIAVGKVLINEGKPKIEAAMHIYVALLGHTQDEVVSAFIEGAALTPKALLPTGTTVGANTSE